MMKKIIAVLLVVMSALCLCFGALADEIPQPEGGMKFESTWAKMNGLVEICYEEEGYRVLVDLYNEVDGTGNEWEYACFYVEEADALVSFSSLKRAYALDPDTLDRTFGENEYEGIDDEDTTSIFALTDDGALVWLDGHENMGADLEFTDIGDFEGVWRNDDEDVYVEMWWQGLYDEESFFYAVYIHRGGEDQYADFHMVGLYNDESGKLEALGTAVTAVLNADGTYTETEDGETYEAFFSDLGDGSILFETDNGIVLEYDLLGPES